jgi:four helix bundle protein
VSAKNELEERTLIFSCKLIDFVVTLTGGVVGDVVARQLLRAGTSIGANYREANRGESKADFIHKIGVCEKEASEANYWLEICSRRRLGEAGLRTSLLDESSELLAIFTTIGRNAKR